MPTAVHASGGHRRHPRWPVERPYLAALKDLGMSDPAIAQYFRVKHEQVASLRTAYGIGEAKVVPLARPRARLFAWRRSA